jgi:hypothetical protein
MKLRFFVLAATLVTISGCSPSSLVGVDELASDATLAGEFIELRLKARVADDVSQILRITVTPDNSVRVSRETLRYSDRRVALPKSEEEVALAKRLSPEQARALRRKLSIFRPAKLSAEIPFAFVTDCPGMSSHLDNVLVVFFSDGRGKGATFLLERSCDTSGAAKALRKAEDIRSTLPMRVSFPKLTTG